MKNITRTHLVDSIIKANASQAYAPGFVDAVVDRVSQQFPNEEKSAIRGLVFSRRASTLGHKSPAMPHNVKLSLEGSKAPAKRSGRPKKSLALA